MACTCGHSEEEHGHDPKYPGSTSCNGVVWADGLEEACDCIAYEANEESE